jgi:hypothetical protein
MEPELQPQALAAEFTSALLTPDWVLIGATIQGSHQLLESRPCQDAQAFLSMDDVLLIAIADGLGTALCAQQGAQLAVQAVLKGAGDLLAAAIPGTEEGWHELLQSSILGSRARLEEEAGRQRAPMADYATTLILAIVSRGWLATAHIGDGAVVMLDGDGVFSMVLTPQNGEYANETFSLTLPDASERVVYQVCQANVQALGLLTDGLQRLSIHQFDGSPHVPFFAPLFQQLPGITDPAKAARSLAGFLSSEKARKLSGDDKTLVLVGRPKAVV